MNSSPLNFGAYLGRSGRAARPIIAPHIGPSPRPSPAIGRGNWETGEGTGLVLDAVVCRRMLGLNDRLVNRIANSDGLRAAEMHRGLAGYLRAESQNHTAVIAAFVSDLAQQMALAMVAGAAARPIRGSRRRYNHDAHVTVLAFVFVPRPSLTLCKIFTRTVSDKHATNS